MEMEPQGVAVSVIEPGNFKSKIRRTRVARTLGVDPDEDEMTDEQKEAYQATVERELSLKEPDEVSEAFKHALFSDAPLRRYVVVPNADEQGRTIRTKMAELVQLNQWGPYSYSRDELVKILDETLNPPAEEPAEEAQ